MGREINLGGGEEEVLVDDYQGDVDEDDDGDEDEDEQIRI